MIRISYIVPFYNGKRYIHECLDSIYMQDIPEKEYEVIVVDDCSTDGESLDVVRAYMKKHNNMRTVHNEQNLRVGGSRNHGIREAKGQYIWFVDQDDKIEPNCAGRLLKICEMNELDYLSFDFTDFDDKGKIEPHRLITRNTEVMTGLEYAYKVCEKNIWLNQWDTNVWHQLYRTEFLRAHYIYFSEVSYFDDMIVALRALMYAKRMQTIPEAYYHYRYNELSVLHTEVGIGGRTLFDGSINAGVVLLDFSHEIKDIDTYFYSYFKEGAIFRANSFTKALLRISCEEQRKFYEQVVSHPDVMYKALPILSKKNRVLATHPWIAQALHPIVNQYRRMRS